MIYYDFIFMASKILSILFISFITASISGISAKEFVKDYDFYDVWIFSYGMSHSFKVTGFHESATGYGNDTQIYIVYEYGFPWFLFGKCKIWNNETILFNKFPGTYSITIYNYSGFMYFQPKIPILYGHCEKIEIRIFR